MTYNIGHQVFVLIYYILLCVLAIYGLHRFYLLYLYYSNKNKIPIPAARFLRLPKITVQLPIYNEIYVAERLVSAVCSMDYPKELLEIQILDDSDDDTFLMLEESTIELKKDGYNILYIHRQNRDGFKAGALREGLKQATGEFIAIFDADFVPPKEFLKATVHFFTDNDIGMVQVRWGHINSGYSLLTQAQSIFLDGHFAIEQAARNRAGKFFNFNGTAGLWRKVCIESAGGWQDDTLTEDLDLSYRAQLKGWRFVYLPDVVANAELPVEINGFKSQQYRWTKGSIQTSRKLLGKILKSRLPLLIKLESVFHLTDYLAYLFSFIIAIFILPSMLLRVGMSGHHSLCTDLFFFLTLFASSSFFYILSQKELYNKWTSRIRYIPCALAIGVGLSLNNAKAALEGLFSAKGEFIRTPKYSIADVKDVWMGKKYRAPKNILGLAELCLGGYFSYVVIYAFFHKMYLSIPFLLIFQAGFIYVGGLSLLQGRRSNEDTTYGAIAT